MQIRFTMFVFFTAFLTVAGGCGQATLEPQSDNSDKFQSPLPQPPRQILKNSVLSFDAVTGVDGTVYLVAITMAEFPNGSNESVEAKLRFLKRVPGTTKFVKARAPIDMNITWDDGNPKIAVDEENVVTVVYSQKGVVWMLRDVTSEAAQPERVGKGMEAQLAMQNGTVHLAYVNNNDRLIYQTHTVESGWSEKDTWEPLSDLGFSAPTMTVDALGRVHLAFLTWPWWTCDGPCASSIVYNLTADSNEGVEPFYDSDGEIELSNVSNTWRAPEFLAYPEQQSISYNPRIALNTDAANVANITFTADGLYTLTQGSLNRWETKLVHEPTARWGEGDLALYISDSDQTFTTDGQMVYAMAIQEYVGGKKSPWKTSVKHIGPGSTKPFEEFPILTAKVNITTASFLRTKIEFDPMTGEEMIFYSRPVGTQSGLWVIE